MTTITEESAQIDETEKTTAPRRRRPAATLVVGLGIVIAIVLFGLVAPFFTQDPLAVSNDGMQGPSAAHLLGTTQTGQDVLAQLAHATRGSLMVGVIVAVLALFLSAFFEIGRAHV